jgi:hypothetical protein
VLLYDQAAAGAIEIRAVDCIEFDPQLRQLDVADELAFLCMDLTALGEKRRARLLCGAYRAAGGDAGPDALVAFYAAYRALVRAKVAIHRQRQHGAAGEVDRAETARLIDLAEHFAWGARGPLVVAVCGVPASGKSTLARALAECAGWPVLAADVTRKHLLGVPVDARAPRSAYTPHMNRRTYTSLATAATEACRDLGAGAIVDATFRHRIDRDAFAEGVGEGLPVVYLECQVPVGELTRRAAERDRGFRGASDADRRIVERERHSWEPLDEIPGVRHIIVRADRPPGDLAAEVAAIVDGRLVEIRRLPADHD